MLKKLKCKSKYGVWYYIKITPTLMNDLDAPIFELYDENKECISEFGSYNEMKSAVEYGDIEEYIRMYG